MATTMRDGMYDGINKRIGAHMRRLRMSRGQSGEDVARRIGKTKDYLYRLERGKSWSVWAFVSVCSAVGMGDQETADLLRYLIQNHRTGEAVPELPTI